MAGKLGRRPVDTVNFARAAKFANIKGAVGLPLPQRMVPLNARAGKLAMLGNDQYGDCVSVMIANMIFLRTGQYPNQAAVYEFYTSQNPDFPKDDNGMNIQEALEYLVKVGMRMPDGSMKKAVFFAKVDHNSAAEIDEAIALFGGIGYGIVVTNANMTQFDKDETWTYTQGDKDEGGHAVIGGGYDSSPLLRHFGTWAEITKWDSDFDESLVDEAWIVLFDEDLKEGAAYLPGVSLSAVAAEFTRVTGKPFPIAVPAPKPTPAPPLVDSSPEDVAMATAAHAYVKHERNTKIAKALNAWLSAKGL